MDIKQLQGAIYQAPSVRIVTLNVVSSILSLSDPTTIDDGSEGEEDNF